MAGSTHVIRPRRMLVGALAAAVALTGLAGTGGPLGTPADAQVGEWYGTASWEEVVEQSSPSGTRRYGATVVQDATGVRWEAFWDGFVTYDGGLCPGDTRSETGRASGEGGTHFTANYVPSRGEWTYSLYSAPEFTVHTELKDYLYRPTATGYECELRILSSSSDYPITQGRHGSTVTYHPEDTYVITGSASGTRFSSDTSTITYTQQWALRRADCTGAPDTDGDGFDDCAEVDAGTDPYDQTSHPSGPPPPPQDNQPPVALDDQVVIPAVIPGGAHPWPLREMLRNDSDPDGDPITIVSAESASGTPVLLHGRVVSYIIVPCLELDTVTYTITDGEYEATATVTIVTKQLPPQEKFC